LKGEENGGGGGRANERRSQWSVSASWGKRQPSVHVDSEYKKVPRGGGEGKSGGRSRLGMGKQRAGGGAEARRCGVGGEATVGVGNPGGGGRRGGYVPRAPGCGRVGV